MKSFNYIGPSMNPLLKSGDRLQITPYRGRQIRRGDVIVFSPPGETSNIIHRVISVDAHGIRTRGDNSDHVDPWVLSLDHIHGRVCYGERKNKKQRIYGGLPGHLVAAAIHAIRRIDSMVSYLLCPAYYSLARSGIPGRWLPARMRGRVLSFTRPAGTELQLVLGRRVIGRLTPGRDQWEIRRPFRLFVDEASLPKGLQTCPWDGKGNRS